MSFEIKEEQLDGKTLLKFCGQIDEEAAFPNVKDWGSSMYIDLGQVTAINSIGIRGWIMWFAQLEGVQMTFLNCPKALVMQMNMVEGFLPTQAQVKSLQVPFFCEECDEEVDVVFEVGKEIQVTADGVQLNYDKSKICKDGNEPELDVSEVKYFRFLLPRKENQAA